MSKLGLYLDIRNLLISLPKNCRVPTEGKKGNYGNYQYRLNSFLSVSDKVLIPENLRKLKLKIPTSRIPAINMNKKKRVNLERRVKRFENNKSHSSKSLFKSDSPDTDSHCGDLKTHTVLPNVRLALGLQ